MKKLKLKLQNFEGTEMLTREQLKTVMGGSGDGDSEKYYATVSCNEHVGTWSYTSMPTCSEIGKDAASYCRGAATIAAGSQCKM